MISPTWLYLEHIIISPTWVYLDHIGSARLTGWNSVVPPILQSLPNKELVTSEQFQNKVTL